MSYSIRLPVQQMADLYEQGWTALDIACHFHTSPQTVLRRLKSHGVKIRERAEWNAGRPDPNYDETYVRDCSSRGMTCHEIADSLNVDAESVRRWMVKRGIPRQEAKARIEHNYFYAGGKTVDSDGYILILSPQHPYRNAGGYVREHRLVMERILGRYLSPVEVVDHVDNDPSNNDPSNLRLFANNAAHLRATLTAPRTQPPRRVKHH